MVILPGEALIIAGARTQLVIAESSCEAEHIAATAATSEAKYILALFTACEQQVPIRSTIGVVRSNGLQCFRHLDVRFLQAETAGKRVPIRKVLRPENVADSTTKLADRRSFEFCRMCMEGNKDPITVSRSSFVPCLCVALAHAPTPT